MDFKKMYEEIGFTGGIYHYDDDEEYHIIISLAPEYGSLPILDDIEGLSIVNEDSIRNYFVSLREDDLRIKCLNGIPTSNVTGFNCDYCHQFIGTLRYHCQDCWKDMCTLCYSERSDEDALKNGAKNYHLRKDSIEKCHNEHHLNWMVDYDYVCCDICSKDIKENVLRDANFATNGDLKYDYDRKDVCEDCMNTVKGQELIKEHNLSIRKIKFKNNCDQSGFGSMLDWVPIYQSNSEAYNFIYYNINKNSPNYSTLACSAEDNHGRLGYYQLPSPYSKLGDSLKGLIQKHVPEYLKIKDTNENSWELFYNSPLNLAMNELGMLVHFG